MHEMSIAMALIDELTSIARREGAVRIKSVNLSIGELAGVEAEALEFCFPFAAENTSVSGAQLLIEKIPVSLQCEACGNLGPRRDFEFICAACNSSRVKVVGGRDLLIKTVEIETCAEPVDAEKSRE